jgi:hypothetical protein
MKSLMLVAIVLGLSACSAVTQPPSEAKARRLEEGRAAAEADTRVQSEAKRLEDRGLTTREARSLAEAQGRVGQP